MFVEARPVSSKTKIKAGSGKRANIESLHMKPPEKDADEEKKAVPEGDMDAGSLFKRCKNAMHVALYVLSEPMHQRLSRLIVTLSAPLRTWHGAQNRDNRSPEASATLHAELACGIVLFKILNETVQLLTNADKLDYIGFSMRFGDRIDGLTLETCLWLDIAKSFFR